MFTNLEKLKMNKSRLYILNIIFFLISCNEKINNFVPEGHNEDGIHEITVYPGLMGDLTKIIDLRSEYVFSELKRKMDTLGIQYFKDSMTCNLTIRKIQPNFSITGFDFDNYYLALISEHKENGNVHTCCGTYQLRGYLNHNSKTIVLKVSSKYTRDGSYTNIGYSIRYVSWVSIPRVSGVWKLEVENNLN